MNIMNISGHKQKCLYKNCICHLCALNTKRRALDQIERQLRLNPHDISKTTSSNGKSSQEKLKMVGEKNSLAECINFINAYPHTISGSQATNSKPVLDMPVENNETRTIRDCPTTNSNANFIQIVPDKSSIRITKPCCSTSSTEGEKDTLTALVKTEKHLLNANFSVAEEVVANQPEELITNLKHSIDLLLAK
uniref:DM domain-containing protein n=1 Tax=Ditylenchus dipsaci TaxID=166011 RepID=A0A915EMQ4_9BILA